VKQNNIGEPLDVKAVEFFEKFIVLGDSLPALLRYPVGIIVTALGIVMLVIPGPGLVFLLGGIVIINKSFGMQVKKQADRYIEWRMNSRRKKLEKQSGKK
jgi:hypothetical protein